MSYFVYILYSASSRKFYKGQTSDLDRRTAEHNSGKELSTKSGAPWRSIWSTTKETRSEALKLESHLKNLSQIRLLEFMQKYYSGYVNADISREFEPQTFMHSMKSGC